MKRYNSNIFKYASQDYMLVAVVSSDDMNVSLDIADIEELSYESKLNSLLVTGHIIYTDRYGLLDKVLHRYYCYCKILFASCKRDHDSDIGTNGDNFRINENDKFQHEFIVTNICVLERQFSVIKYKINIVSKNWFNCISNIEFSNYGKKPQQLFDIVKSCLVNSGLNVDENTFKSVQSKVELNYISKQNDNAFSALKYLLHKLYYMPEQKDDSVKFLVYDMYKNQYRLLDVKDSKTFTGVYSTMLSFFKTNTEQLIQQEPTNIGSFLQPIGQNDVYRNMFQKNIWNYDYMNNMFKNDDIQNETLVNYMNNKTDFDREYEPKFQKLDIMQDLKYFQSGSYWNNMFDVYGQSVQAFEENDSFVLNITGEIARQAGSCITISIDRSITSVTSDSKRELEDIKKKYRSYEGPWMVSKVRTFVYPGVQSFRQQLAIFRNFQQARLKDEIAEGSEEKKKNDKDKSGKEKRKKIKWWPPLKTLLIKYVSDLAGASKLAKMSKDVQKQIQETIDKANELMEKFNKLEQPDTASQKNDINMEDLNPDNVNKILSKLMELLDKILKQYMSTIIG